MIRQRFGMPLVLVPLAAVVLLAGAAPRPVGGQEIRDPGFRDRDRNDASPQIQLVPPGRRVPDRARWRLGVHAQNTRTGAVISSVVPNSPAWQAGIEPGDVVVTVDGYQVGFVDGRTFDLGDELQRRAAPDGRVSLLLHDRRTGQLAVRDVRLERAGLPITRPPRPPFRDAWRFPGERR